MCVCVCIYVNISDPEPVPCTHIKYVKKEQWGCKQCNQQTDAYKTHIYIEAWRCSVSDGGSCYRSCKRADRRHVTLTFFFAAAASSSYCKS